MKDPIVESLAKIRALESKEILNEFTAPPGLAAAGKLGGKLLPGVGLALAAQDAYSRQQAGDTTGAAIAGLTGAASSIPVVGTAASLIGTGVQAVRDKMRTGSWMPDEKEIAAGVAKDATAQPAAAPATAVAQAKPAAAPTTPAPPGADPKVIALQKQLIAKGAKITADGKMGPATQAAMKQFPGTAVAEQFKGTTMSEAQKIAELRDRLAQFESQAQVTDEAWGTAAKGVKDVVGNAWGAAKNFVGGVGKGIANPAATNLKNVAAGTTASTKGIKTGAAVARNPGKVAVGAAAAGAAGMAALGGGAAANKPTAPKPAAPKPAAPKPAAPVETPNAAADPAEVAELNAMAAELENSQDPADIEMLKRYNSLINAINNGAKDDKRTIGQQAANAELSASGAG
jgi:peptidoglycan hydrolase-like protein with peptidoglycan-binding domain